MAWEEMTTQEVVGRERLQRHEGIRHKQDRNDTHVKRNFHHAVRQLQQLLRNKLQYTYMDGSMVSWR